MTTTTISLDWTRDGGRWVAEYDSYRFYARGRYLTVVLKFNDMVVRSATCGTAAGAKAYGWELAQHVADGGRL